MQSTFRTVALLALTSLLAIGQPQPGPLPASATPAKPRPQQQPTLEQKQQTAGYILGAEDQISIWALEVDELTGKLIPVDGNGDINVPLIGRVHVAGLTVRQLEVELIQRLRTFIKEPQLTVSVTEFRSQPVSIIGAVNQPGIHQLRGPRTLVEVLSSAGGLRQDAGNTIKITRKLDQGAIPLKNAAVDHSGGFSVAEVSLKTVMEARNPEENILVRAHDVISIPRADMVYVLGEVAKAGGFIMAEKDNISVLQAVALAGGLNPQAQAKNARILRAAAGSPQRTERPVNVQNILSGKQPDMMMEPDDILFIPTNGPKKAAARITEAAIQTVTGIAIFGSTRR